MKPIRRYEGWYHSKPLTFYQRDNEIGWNFRLNFKDLKQVDLWYKAIWSFNGDNMIAFNESNHTSIQSMFYAFFKCEIIGFYAQN